MYQLGVVGRVFPVVEGHAVVVRAQLLGDTAVGLPPFLLAVRRPRLVSAGVFRFS